MINITGVLVCQCSYLTCVEKAVFFSHKHKFVANLNLKMPAVKVRYLDKDHLVFVTRLIEDSVL